MKPVQIPMPERLSTHSADFIEGYAFAYKEASFSLLTLLESGKRDGDELAVILAAVEGLATSYDGLADELLKDRS